MASIVGASGTNRKGLIDKLQNYRSRSSVMIVLTDDTFYFGNLLYIYENIL